MRRRSLLHALVGVWILSAPSPGAAESPIDLSTPERTIATFFRGYSTGNKSMIHATILGGVSELGLGIESKYRIVAKKLILETIAVGKPGDIEIVTHEVSLWPAEKGQKEEVRTYTTFYLRRFGNEWKIVDWFGNPLPPSVMYLGP